MPVNLMSAYFKNQPLLCISFILFSIAMALILGSVMGYFIGKLSGKLRATRLMMLTLIICEGAKLIAANNEYETGEPQVKITEKTTGNFSSGSEIKMSAHSMLVLKWKIVDCSVAWPSSMTNAARRKKCRFASSSFEVSKERRFRRPLSGSATNRRVRTITASQKPCNGLSR